LGLVTVDVLSSIVLVAGAVLLLLPVILHSGVGADNDAYLVIAEGGRQDPVVLVQMGLEWMFRRDYAAVAAVVTGAAFVVKALVWWRQRRQTFAYV